MAAHQNRNEPQPPVCTVCGGKIERPSASCPDVCYGCWLDSLVPDDYWVAESYSYSSYAGHRNATLRPPTGVEILDESLKHLPPSMQAVPRGAHPPRYMA
ncbi:MAG: hypothetical protein ABFD92_16745 [Planctomycetaceae bacterium]|nr:hypothetical protein [Planctomycetaceae bacterium]